MGLVSVHSLPAQLIAVSIKSISITGLGYPLDLPLNSFTQNHVYLLPLNLNGTPSLVEQLAMVTTDLVACIVLVLLLGLRLSEVAARVSLLKDYSKFFINSLLSCF